MPKTYTCEKCSKVFKQKGHFTEHQNKKNECTNPHLERILEEKVEEKVKEVFRSIIKPKEVTLDNLDSFFEDFHNLLWNKVGLSPEKAMQHMNLFFAYRMLELQADSLALPKECRWSYIAGMKSASIVDGSIKKGITEFRKNPITKPFFFAHEIKKEEVVDDIVQLMSRISLETLQQTDTLGRIFEHMLGRGMSTMADDGQYFTDRLICRLAFKLAFDIKKTLRRPDGSLCTFADWFCGTGGFMTEYIKGVKQNLTDIVWKTDKTSIYAQDQNESSVTTSLLNALIATGEPFLPTTIRMGNSFSEPITRGDNAPYPTLSVDYCFMNPPYGGDKTKGKAYKFAYAKGKGNDKTYSVNQDIRTIGIEDDDKVSAGVQLAMATLSEGGVCCIVLPQGFFFGASKKCVELRKKIAEEYRIHYVVDIASGSFLNTGTKTSMLVFQKGVGATQTVTFMGLNEAVLVEATLEDLRKKNYSLNFKQYLPQSAVEVDGFEMVRLGDIVRPFSMKHHSTTDGNNHGKYPLISSALSVEYFMDTFDSETPSLIFNTINADGNCSVHYYEKFNTTSNTYVLTCENTITLQYLYYYLKTQPDLLTGCFEGTTKKALSRPLLQSIEIPLPSIDKQQEIVEQIDFYTQMAHTEEQSLKILEKIVMGWVKEMGRGKERVKLGEVCSVKTGKYITKATSTSGIYPTYGGGDAGACISEYNRENEFMISKDGVSEKCVRYVSGKFFLNHHGWTIEPKDVATYSYIGYWLLSNQDKLYDLAAGTAQKGINQDSFYSIEIPIPSLAEQQTLQSDFDEIRHKHAKIAEYKAKAQDAIQRLIPVAK